MLQLSVWEKETFFAPKDVVIVGSGFVGLWSALKLVEKNPHLKITVLERGIIPTGASTRNAGFSCFGSPSELLNDVVQMGEEKTLELVNLRYRGLAEIRKYFADGEIGYHASGGYECFTSGTADWQQSTEKLTWLNRKLQPITGERNTFSIADEKLAVFGFKGFDHLIENKLEGGLHSGKLVQALLQRVQSLGVQVLTNIEVLSYLQQDGCVTITTNLQISLSAKQLLLCTNAFTKQLIPGIDIVQNRGQVMLSAPIENFKLKGTFHFDRGYYYFRNLGNRLLIGGARNKALKEEETDVMRTSEVIQQELENFIRAYLLPYTAFTITDRWSGIMAMGSEKLPIVEAVDQNVFCCVRMSGMGVALAPVVAEQVVAVMNACRK